MIKDNIRRRLYAVGVLLENALKPGISTREKSSYYRSALIILSTIVEGLVYELVKTITAHNGHIVGTKSEHEEKHKISKNVFGTPNDFWLCEKRKVNIMINDEGVTFGNLNSYLKNNHHVSTSEYNLLNWTRKERNNIHLQGLSKPDINYTKHKVDKAGKALNFLIRKLIALEKNNVHT